MTEEVTRLRELSKRRHLPERDTLNQKLSATTLALQEKEKEAQVNTWESRFISYGTKL